MVITFARNGFDDRTLTARHHYPDGVLHADTPFARPLRTILFVRVLTLPQDASLL
jgi:hypothetical protein